MSSMSELQALNERALNPASVIFLVESNLRPEKETVFFKET